MFCPKCGTQPQIIDQKFCKTCGTNLMVISQVLNVSNLEQHQQVVSSAVAQGSNFGVSTCVPLPINQIPQAMSNPSLNIFMEEEAKRQKLRKIGWMLVGGGILWPILFGVLGDILSTIIGSHARVISELAGLCALFFAAGFLLILYARFILKKTTLPQVIFVPQPSITLPENNVGQVQVHSNLPRQNEYPAVLPYYPSVTEHTTERLHVPLQIHSKEPRS